MVIDYSK